MSDRIINGKARHFPSPIIEGQPDMTAREVIEQEQAELRRLKELRPKCDRRGCDQPSTLRSVLCRVHLAEHEDSMGTSRALQKKFGAPVPTRIYVCPQCLDETDDPSHLCKCPE